MWISPFSVIHDGLKAKTTTFEYPVWLLTSSKRLDQFASGATQQYWQSVLPYRYAVNCDRKVCFWRRRSVGFFVFVWNILGTAERIYDTIRWTILTCAQKLTSSQLSLPHAAKQKELECGPMPNLMVALPNIGGALCSTPQSLADAHY